MREERGEEKKGHNVEVKHIEIEKKLQQRIEVNVKE